VTVHDILMWRNQGNRMMTSGMPGGPIAERLGGSGPSPLEFRPRTVIVASILAAAVIATAGSLSDVCLSDENHHVRQVQAYAQAGRRVSYDPAFALDDLVPSAFSCTPLWHAGLAVLWRLAGTKLQTLAQVYQASFYLLLLLSVYFGTRRIWGPSAASWAWLFIASMPMVCVYSMLLYQDVPGIAVSALGFLLLFRGNFLGAGLCFAAAYLTKMNMLSYAPWAVAVAGWRAEGTLKRRLVAAALVAVPVAVALGYDTGWRLTNYGIAIGAPPPDFRGLSASALAAITTLPANYVAWQRYPVWNPEAFVMKVGVPVTFGIFLLLFVKWDAASKWIWICLGCALGAYVFVFVVAMGFPYGWSNIRYLLPVVFVLALLCGEAFAKWRPWSWLKVVLVLGCLVQGLLACGYTYCVRRVSEADIAACAWIRENTPEKARIMCPEQDITNQTGRPVIWLELNPAYFMTQASDQQRLEVLRCFRVFHIVIPRCDIYDRDKEGDHHGGYPRDFVEKAHTLPYLEKVYENDGFLIFKFNPHLTFNPSLKIPLAESHPRVALTKTEGG